jgi:hypothetical protein
MEKARPTRPSKARRMSNCTADGFRPVAWVARNVTVSSRRDQAYNPHPRAPV